MRAEPRDTASQEDRLAAASKGWGRREAKEAAQSLGPGQNTARTAGNLGNLVRADTDTMWEETLNLSINLT